MTLSTADNSKFDIKVDGVVHDVHRFGDVALRERGARILMFPDFEGTESSGASRLARGYARACGAEVLLTDLYGKSSKPNGYDRRADSVIRHARAHPIETRRRLVGILAALVPHWRTDGQLLTVGFCFGGSLAFELARADRSVIAGVSIHGDPSTEAPMSAGVTGAEFTMIHGGSDPLIPPESISSFTQEANVAQVGWQLIVLGHARHSFTKHDMAGSNWAMRYDQDAGEVARAHVATIAFRHGNATR